MFSQPVVSSSGSALPWPATVHPAWFMGNPNVDRAAPPRKKKRAKKKPVTKKKR